MKNIGYEIQNNETDIKFPFRLFFNKGVRSQNHCHKEIEFLYVLNNSMNIYLNGKKHTLNKDDVMMISSGDIHGIEDSDHARLVLQFKIDLLEGKYIEKDDIYAIYEKLHSLERISHNWPQCTTNKVIKILLELSVNPSLEDPGNRIKILYLVYKLIYICITEVPKSSDTFQANHLIYNKKAMQTLERAFSYINNNYNQKISLDDISSLFHYSPEYFSRLWKKYTGVTFHKYLNEYRINKATLLLKETDLTISEICFKTGFESIKTFNRVFKTVIGSSPSEYRQVAANKT